MNTLHRWFIELVLRTLSVVTVGMILLNVWSIYKSYTAIINPLIPNELGHYSAFPHYAFVFFYGGVLFMIWKFLKQDSHLKKWWIAVVYIAILEFFKFYIYGFLMWLNPFG